jgi:beta-lactamase regulating signal transducer with metallopeptidase domain
MWFNTLFPQILNMSLTAGVAIVFVLLARLLLRKAPKIFSYALWAVVLFRLLCPLSFESPVSIVPDRAPITSVQIEAVIPPVTFQTPANMETNRVAEAENPDNPVYVSSDAGGNVVITFVWLIGIAAC